MGRDDHGLNGTLFIHFEVIEDTQEDYHKVCLSGVMISALKND